MQLQSLQPFVPGLPGCCNCVCNWQAQITHTVTSSVTWGASTAGVYCLFTLQPVCSGSCGKSMAAGVEKSNECRVGMIACGSKMHCFWRDGHYRCSNQVKWSEYLYFYIYLFIWTLQPLLYCNVKSILYIHTHAAHLLQHLIWTHITFIHLLAYLFSFIDFTSKPVNKH